MEGTKVPMGNSSENSVLPSFTIGLELSGSLRCSGLTKHRLGSERTRQRCKMRVIYQSFCSTLTYRHLLLLLCIVLSARFALPVRLPHLRRVSLPAP